MWVCVAVPLFIILSVSQSIVGAHIYDFDPGINEGGHDFECTAVGNRRKHEFTLFQDLINIGAGEL